MPRAEQAMASRKKPPVYEDLMKGFFDSAPNAIFLVDKSGYILAVNKQVKRIFGYRPSELAGKKLEILVPEHIRNEHHSFCAAYFKKPRIRLMGAGDLDLQGKRKDGNLFPIEISLSSIKTRVGMIAIAVARDITEQKKREESLRRSNRALRALSLCNQALLRAVGEKEFLNDVCHMLVEICGYRSAWLGYLSKNKRNPMQVAAQAGYNNSHFTSKRLLEENRDNIYKQFQTGKIIIEQDIFSNPKLISLRDEAKKHSYASRIRLPLGNERSFKASLTICAVEPESFDREEKKLLAQLSGSLTYGIKLLREQEDRKYAEATAARAAYFDLLTDLPNRNLIHDRLRRAIVSARRRNLLLAVLFVNLYRFKHINDALGYPAGDKLLKMFARRLSTSFHEEDIIGRFGGDQFVIALHDIKNVRNAKKLADRILAAASEPFKLQKTDIYLSPAIGISLFPDNGDTPETLIGNADAAMRQAKKRGGNTSQFYTAELNKESAKHLTLEYDLRKAVERNEFVVYYQPVVDLKSKQISGAEALVRWQHPTRGLLQPASFISTAEESGLIAPIGNYVLTEAAQENLRWRNAGFGSLIVSVNISTYQIYYDDIIETVTNMLAETGLDPDRLELEITESVVMRQTQEIIALLSKLRRLGIRIAIDDFGTGYSSLSYLRRFPVSTLKIDRSFVANLTSSSDDAAIVKVIVSLAKALHLSVIAEGVETTEELDFMASVECDRAQGYLFSKPVPASEFLKLLKQDREYRQAA